MALGARPTQVRRMLAGEGLKLTAIGLALGLPGAVAGGGLLRGFLYGISTSSLSGFLGSVLANFLGTAAVFAAVALAASYLPARRAAQVDPIEAMKSE